MKWQHLSAFLWLRYRLRVNQLQRGGIGNLVLLAVLAFFVVFGALGLFLSGLLLGWLALGNADPVLVVLTWDILVGLLLFIWIIVLLNDLQRSDLLTLDKFLHLPVSPVGAFVINYLSSLVNITLLLFLAAAIGLNIGLALSRGPLWLLLLPLLAAFTLALTALTYQFQGWLASLMTNPRRRRLIIVVLTGIFILIIQVPNLYNILKSRREAEQTTQKAAQDVDQAKELRQALADKRITDKEFKAQTQALEKQSKEQREEQRRQFRAELAATLAWFNLALPPFWLPLGAAGLAEDNPLPGLFGLLGLSLIGLLSLWSAYRTTLRIYTGRFTSRPAQVSTAPAPAERGAEQPAVPKPTWMDLYWRSLPDQATAVALGNGIGLWRAPEFKMALVTPFLIGGIVAALAYSRGGAPSAFIRPLIVLGFLAMVLVLLTQVTANLFGLDRGGFRIYVLSPLPRHYLLLGKNLSLALPPLCATLLALLLVEYLYPLRWDHLLALLPQAVSMYLFYCIVGNFLSIIAPIAIAPGAFKPTKVELLPVLLHLMGTLVLGVLFSLVLLPLVLDYLTEEYLGWSAGLLNLLGSLLGLAIAVPLYRLSLRWMGGLLQRREQDILQVLTGK